MALLGPEGRKIAGAYKSGTGTITFITAASAYAKPDQEEYGRQVYIPGGLADKKCVYKLNSKYKVGDRVAFTYVKAANPELGCEWAVIGMSKIDDDDNVSVASMATLSSNDYNNASSGWKTMKNSRNGTRNSESDELIRNAKGRIDYNGISFAYIKLDHPIGGRAFMADRSVNGHFTDENGIFSLAKMFPPLKRVTCDLERQPMRNGCVYFAKNVVVDHSETQLQQEQSHVKKSSGSGVIEEKRSGNRPDLNLKYSPPLLTSTNQQHRPPATATIAKVNPAENVKVADAIVQTDPTIEAVLLEKIFGDEELFGLICERQPKLVYRYTSSRVRGRNALNEQ